MSVFDQPTVQFPRPAWHAPPATRGPNYRGAHRRAEPPARVAWPRPAVARRAAAVKAWWTPRVQTAVLYVFAVALICAAFVVITFSPR